MKTRITIHERIDFVHCIVMVVTFSFHSNFRKDGKTLPDSRRTGIFLFFVLPALRIDAGFSIVIRIKDDSNHLKSCPEVFL